MRLILADDHNLFREALCYYLRQASRNVELMEAASLDDALCLAGDGTAIDAMLLDYVMPGMDGLVGIRRVKEKFPDIPLVLLSGNISNGEAQEAMRLGAAGVISKQLTGKALVEALNRILSSGGGRSSLAWTGVAAPRETTIPPSGVATGAAAGFDLTPREAEVIRLLTRGLANKAIAQELGIAGITVRLHLRNAFRKMRARNRLDALRIALEAGLSR